MSLVRKTLANKHFRLLVIISAVLGVAGLAVAWKLGLDFATLKQLWSDTLEFLRANPWALFLAIVFLPGLPVPVTALLLTAGLVWSDNLPLACTLAILAIALNMTWTYWVAAYPARGLVEKLIASTSLKIPDLPRKDHVRLILIFRLTPGIPLFIHNYVLGFLRTPFHIYLPLSLLLSGPIMCGILITGGALFEGSIGTALIGVSLLVVGIVVTKMLRTRYVRNKAATLSQDATEPDPAAEI